MCLLVRNCKYKFMAMRKPCAAIPVYASKLMHCAATDAWKYCLRMSSLITCGKTCENMWSFIRLWYDRMKETKGFLLKTYLENHKPRVDGNTSACLVTKAIEKENTRYQRKLKRAASAISVYTSRLMCLKIKARILQNLLCPTKNRLYTNTSKIICNSVSNQLL